MVSITKQIKAFREASYVERFHICPHHGSYSVGLHSFNAVNLLLLLHPNPSTLLVKAVLWHDVAERWAGDAPAPAKKYSQGYRREYENVEEHVFRYLGVHRVFTQLTGEDAYWLKAVDLLEFHLWTKEQIQLGNLNVRPSKQEVEEYIDKLICDGNFPPECKEFYESDADARRLPDNLNTFMEK